MSSEVEICNLALSNIRAGSINSLDQPSLPAQVCKLKYSILRDRLLTEIPWGFNRVIRGLSLLSVEVFNWSYAYRYPVDCLKVQRLIPAYEEIPAGSSDVISRRIDSDVRNLKYPRQQIPYEVLNVGGDKVIASDNPDLRIDFAARVTDPNLFTSDFTLALSHLLAAEIAIPIIGADTGRQLRSDSLTMYQEYLSAAIANDMNDGYDSPSESEFVDVRS